MKIYMEVISVTILSDKAIVTASFKTDHPIARDARESHTDMTDEPVKYTIPIEYGKKLIKRIGQKIVLGDWLEA